MNTMNTMNNQLNQSYNITQGITPLKQLLKVNFAHVFINSVSETHPSKPNIIISFSLNKQYSERLFKTKINETLRLENKRLSTNYKLDTLSIDPQNNIYSILLTHTPILIGCYCCQRMIDTSETLSHYISGHRVCPMCYALIAEK